jgi:uncharacterized protein (TIGR02246 family)
MQILPEERAVDGEAVRVLTDALVATWDRNDADAYGALFTSDASYTIFVGTRYCGRTAVIESHRALFRVFLKGTRLAGEVQRIRFLGSDVAVVTSHGDTYKRRRPRRLSKVQTLTVVREADGRWRVAAFHNTQRRPLMEAVSSWLLPATAPS